MSLAFVMIAARSNSFCWISFFPGGCRKARGWGRPKSYQAEALEYIFRGAVGFRLESHSHLPSLHTLYRWQWDRSSRHSLVGNHGPAILFVANGDPFHGKRSGWNSSSGSEATYFQRTSAVTCHHLLLAPKAAPQPTCQKCRRHGG